MRKRYNKKKLNNNFLYFILNLILYPCNYCINYNNKYENLKKAGTLVDKPNDYTPEKYGYIKTHGIFDVGVYYKYGDTWTLEDGRFHYNYI